MFRFVNKFLGKSRGGRAAKGQARSIRPVLEQLEDRYALSAISAVPIATSPGEVFAVGSDHSLKEYHNGNPPVTLSPAGTILSVSSGRLDDVYAVASDHSLWRWTPTQPGDHWQMLSPAGTITEQIFATVNDGEVFAVPTDASLWRHTNAGWAPLLAPNTTLNVSVDHFGDAFVLGIDHSLTEMSGGASTLLSPAGTILSISAGFSGDVFVVASDHSLWHHDSTWSLLSAAGSIESISAGYVNNEVYAVTTDHGLWHYKSTLPADHWEQLSPAQTITDDISADYSGDVFVVPTDHSLWDHSFSGWKAIDSPNTTL
jgi:hypothetical protein